MATLRVAKAICALSNHGGGHVIVGLRSNDGEHTYELSPNDEWATQYTLDTVNGIGDSYLEPSIHCHVAHIPYPPNPEKTLCVISVPASEVPVILKRAGPDGEGITPGVYIRRTNLSSAAPQTAAEWKTLLTRCVRANRDDFLDAIRTIMSGGEISVLEQNEKDILMEWIASAKEDWEKKNNSLPDGVDSKISHGYWWVGYFLKDATPLPSMRDLSRTLDEKHIRHTGWPLWVTLNRRDMAPYPNAQGDLECWLGREMEGRHYDDVAHADYWGYSKDGKGFSLRGYIEDTFETDTRRPMAPGIMIDLTLPIWRFGESLLHAHAMAEPFNCLDKELVFKTGWTGLEGRELGSLSPGRYLSGGYTSHTSAYEYSGSVPVHTIPDNLPEIVHRVLMPLYERFDMFQLSMGLVTEELARMRRDRFNS